MDFNGTIYATKHSGGIDSYLIAPENLDAFLRYVTWAETTANWFCNVTVNPTKATNITPLLFGYASDNGEVIRCDNSSYPCFSLCRTC